MSITIIGDCHLGLNRASHTTPASRDRLKQRIFEQAKKFAPFSHKVMKDVYCLGDLFDTYWSDATTVKQGLEIVQHVDICLIGNHDFSQRSNAKSALEFCFEVEERKWDDPAKASVCSLPAEGFFVQYINHKMTQTLFDESIDKVRAVGGLLLLHCNYNSDFASDEASLNLTEAQAELLLGKVDKIFIGHAHQPDSYFSGRLILTGNIHPTSFSDISDKYIYRVDSEMNVTKELVWDMKRNHLKFDYKSLLEPIHLEGYEFLEITGVAERSELPSIARAISNIWKTCSTALMVKNSVTCEKQEVEVLETQKFSDVLTQVSTELKDTKLYPVWQHYLEAVA
jgi:DNA repair exonuclease SbcCD nuclease subunit